MNEASGCLMMLETGTEESEFRKDVIMGLSRKQKTLPAKYFYDLEGSKLFDAICDLPEYYPTRTEISIMQSYAPEMAERISGEILVIELGSGSSLKTPILLNALHSVVRYVPLDISVEHLQNAAEKIQLQFPSIPVEPVAGDFTAPLILPEKFREPDSRLVYFPGSTIGNLTAGEAVKTLQRIAGMCAPFGYLLLGADLQKDVKVLEAAYNDSRGVTARFNLNLVHRIHKELESDIDPNNFEHLAFYNPEYQRIEMHLRSCCDQVFTVDCKSFSMRHGETIHTENSHKYTRAGMTDLAGKAGFAFRDFWTDDQEFFGVFLFELKDS